MNNRLWLGAVAVVTVGVLSLGTRVVPASAQGAWYAEYFANRDLLGSPSLTRYENQIHSEWGNGGPGGGIPSDNFSARWTRDEWFEAGTYRFSYRSDDGIRIWVGNTLVVDDWHDRSATWSSVDHSIPRGTHHVMVEYYEHAGAAAVQARWERISGGSAWQAEYFANRNLTGAPVLARSDAAIDFDWDYGGPDGSVPADNFSVRWTHTLGFTPGTYRFYASCDDGVRIYVDGNRVVDAWFNQELPNTRTGDVVLTSGQHTVVVEYYEHGGEASAHVWWNLLAPFSNWHGRYYDNSQMRGGPALIRDDALISFDWGEGAPAEWMPADSFSVVWMRQVTFAPAYYRLNVRADDGVRVWIDDAIVMNYWQPQDYDWHYLEGLYLEGLHTVKVEYFEQAGLARVRFWWEPSQTAPSPGASSPAPAPSAVLPGPWRAEYYDNRDLAGTPALVRNDSAIDFNWDFDAPVPAITRDDFSVRWSGVFPFEAGRYSFTTSTDDGVRLYIDDQLIIDSWRPMRGTLTGYTTVSAGSHRVRLEYFERSQAAMARLNWQRTGSLLPASSPAVQPGACAGGELRLDTWPVSKACASEGSGWTATIFVQGHGGDCRYSYAWEGQIQGGPTAGSMTFEVPCASRGSSIVGYASMTSGGQTVRRPVFVKAPTCQ
jgi:hypothetical protein